ncbi:hypothetical protein DSO57_1010568 [Entomophthora muscae]|uniref:Uncharacterized protein n=1 Tax=Entomophthora muscae TaxID=34485 RepID=A0ACC2TIE7_9FUNG|nr:hypothetical protein DSO57_1010568 [Entomophthora muscae]
MAKNWTPLYMPKPYDSFSNLLLQIICILTISTSILCYTTTGSKISKPSFRNIPDTYSCVTNKLSPTVNVKALTATKQKFTANVQTSAITEQIHSTTTRKPTTTKLLPTAIEQMPIATAQAPTTLTSPTCKPSSNQASMSQPAICQPLPSYSSRPVSIHSFEK